MHMKILIVFQCYHSYTIFLILSINNHGHVVYFLLGDGESVVGDEAVEVDELLNTISLINFIKYLPGYVPPYLFLLLMILLLSHRSVLSAGLVVVQFEVFVHFHCHLIWYLLHPSQLNG